MWRKLSPCRAVTSAGLVSNESSLPESRDMAALRALRHFSKGGFQSHPA